MIAILRAVDRVATQWKNGGGVTREVAIWPPGSSFDGFDWRVSIAEVREPGPFSRFENIDRTMTILAGRLALSLPDRTIELDAQSAPFFFAGDVSCEGYPIGGPVTDLNVMTRRGRVTALVERFGAAATTASQRLIVATAPTTVTLDGSQYELGEYDAALMAGAVSAVTGEGYAIAFG